MKKINTVEDVLSKLDEYIELNRKLKIRDVYNELGIFDWWKDYLTVSNMKDMKRFLRRAYELGFRGNCCFKVGISGCANGMWAHKNDSTATGHSPDGPVLYKSFTPAYNYWAISLDGDRCLPRGDNYDSLKTFKQLKEYLNNLNIDRDNYNWLNI